MRRYLEGPPIAFAHQGGAREGPSSTLFAISNAIWKGATGIELDVHQSADGVLVCCHDARLDRTTNGSGAIAELTIAEIERLDAGYFFVYGRGAARRFPEHAYLYRGQGPHDPRFRVARLSDVLTATEGVVLNLDIKQRPPAVPPYEAALAEALRAGGRTDNVIVTSFSDRSVEAFSHLAPEIATAPGEREITAFVQAVLAGAEPDARLARHVAVQVPVRAGGVRIVDERLVARAHRLGLAVHVWTIDNEQEMAQLLDLGVDGIMSDRPSLLCEVMRHHAGRVRAARGADPSS